jgi:hypothetical protein
MGICALREPRMRDGPFHLPQWTPLTAVHLRVRPVPDTGADPAGVVSRPPLQPLYRPGSLPPETGSKDPQHVATYTAQKMTSTPADRTRVGRHKRFGNDAARGRENPEVSDVGRRLSKTQITDGPDRCEWRHTPQSD